jgi:hypothetical protein
MHRRKCFIEVVLCLLVLGLALFLRIRRLDTTGLWGDQSFTLNLALRWVNGGAMPLAANKSSAGFMNPPMIEYLYAAALRIWPDILSVAILTMISGMVAVAGWSAYKVWGKRAALWATLIFAVNPWGVFYSQLIWNQTMVPVFSSLTLACLLAYFAVEQRPIYLIFSFVWAACMTQVHPGTGVQLLTTGLICALFWRKLRFWPLVAGVALFALLYTPFLLYERGVHWMDVQAVLELARQPVPFSPAVILVSLDILHAQGLLGIVKYVRELDHLATGLLTLSLVYALWASIRTFIRPLRTPQATQKAAGLYILLLWFILPILFYLRPSHHLQTYYLIGQLPAHFMLIAISLDEAQLGLERFACRARQPTVQRAIQVVVWAVLPLPLLAWVGWQCAFNVQFQDHRFQSNAGPPQIRHIRAAIQKGHQLLAERPGCDLVAVSKGHNVETSELSLLREFVSPERVLLTDGQLAIPIPTPCAIYLEAWRESRASAWLASVAAPLPGSAIEMRGKTWSFYDLPADRQARIVERPFSRQPVAAWTNGVALMDYARGNVRPGTTLPLTFTWVVQTSPLEVTYHVGTYLLTLDNQVVAQADGPGFDSIQWQAGDAFIAWFDIPIPQDLKPGEYQIAVAWYTWPELERVNLTTGGNTAFLEQIQIPEP